MRICNGNDFEKRHVWSNIASEMVTNTINYTYLKGYILKLNRTYTTLPFASSVSWQFFPSQNWCWKTEYSVGICHLKFLCPNWVELLNGIKKRVSRSKGRWILKEHKEATQKCYNPREKNDGKWVKNRHFRTCASFSCHLISFDSIFFDVFTFIEIHCTIMIIAAY